MTRKTLSWGLIGLAIVLAAALAAWFLRSREEPVSYRSAKIERGSLQAVVAATGTVNPVSQVQVGTQVSGQIKELLVDFNSEVKRDQLIARIDPETFEYRLRQANADVDAARSAVLTAQANVLQSLAQASRARVDVQEAERDLARKRDLVAQNFVSPADADTARAKVATLAETLKAAQAQVEVSRAQVQSAQAAVKQREAALAQARVDLERTQIRSPVDGIVIKRSVEVGQTVAASLQAPELFIIARNLSDMQVEASIDESDISRVRVGQKASFTIDAFPGRQFDAAVNQIRKAAVSAQNVVTYTVVSAFTNPGNVLLPGMTANVRIVTDQRESALKLPNAALRVRIAGVEPPASAPGNGSGNSPASSAGARLGALAGLGEARAQSGDAAASGAAGGGPLRDLRERLLRELALDAAQTEKVDALIAALRPRFGELRAMPEEERPKARERLMADLRARVAELLTPEQKTKYQQIVAESGARQSTRGRVYALGEDGKPRAFDVRLGISDGSMTELLLAPGSPAAEALKEGTSVVTGLIGAANRPAGAAPAGPRPFF